MEEQKRAQKPPRRAVGLRERHYRMLQELAGQENGLGDTAGRAIEEAHKAYLKRLAKEVRPA